MSVAGQPDTHLWPAVRPYPNWRETRQMSVTVLVSAEGTIDSGRLSNQKGQEPGIDSWSVRMADSCIKRRPILSDRWSYESGLVLKGIEQVWLDRATKSTCSISNAMLSSLWNRTATFARTTSSTMNLIKSALANSFSNCTRRRTTSDTNKPHSC